MKMRFLRSLIFMAIPVMMLFLIQCSGISKQKAVEANQKYLEIALAFNTKSYPWMLGTKYPQLAVWAESEDGRHETVFVTQGAGKDKWMFADERPGALPVWTGTRPEKRSPDIDAVT